MSTFEGIISPMLTPFTKEEAIDEEKLRSLVNFLIDRGIHGLFPLSSVGEASSLTMKEKKRVIRIVLNEAKDRVPVLPGTGSTSKKSTIELTKYVEKEGGAGAIVVTPYYLQPDQEGLRRYFREVANAVELPLILYQIPSLTGVEMTPSTVQRLEREQENIIGIKDSSGDFERILEIERKTTGDFLVFQGIDSLLLPSLMFGCAGGINATTNVKPSFALKVYEQEKEGAITRAKQIQHRKLTPLTKACMMGVFPAGFKAVARKIGEDWDQPRAPIRSTNDNEEERITTILRDLKLL